MEAGGAAGPAGGDASAPISWQSRVLAAIAAKNATALNEVLASLPASAGADEVTVKAGRAASEVLAELAAKQSALTAANQSAADHERNAEAEASRRKQAESSAKSGAAEHQAAQAQMQRDVAVARGTAPASSDAQLRLVAQETRINELQAVVVSLQTKLRSSEMREQQGALELANTKESAGPTLKAMRATEDELAHTQRLLRTSEASNATLTNQLSALQSRSTGVAIATGSSRPARAPTQAEGKPGTMPALQAGEARGGGGGEGGGVPFEGVDVEEEVEEPMPTSLGDCQHSLTHERARVRLLKAELSAVRAQSEDHIERQRRGADRGLREMQTEFARLHRANAEMKEAANMADHRVSGEVGFRRRAEQGWLKSQQELERAQAELQQQRVQTGELEGRLAAAAAVAADLEGAKKTINALQGKAAADDARLLELLESQKLNSQHVAVAMGHAQQHAAAEYERLQAEHSANHGAALTQINWWRARAEKTKAKAAAAAANLGAARSSLESLLSRLVTATSVADMADQSRLLFEIKAGLIDVEEVLRRPDSSGGVPPEAPPARKPTRKTSGPTAPAPIGGSALGGLGGPAPLGGAFGSPLNSSSAPALQLPGIGPPFASAMGSGFGALPNMPGPPPGFPGFGGFGGMPFDPTAKGPPLKAGARRGSGASISPLRGGPAAPGAAPIKSRIPPPAAAAPRGNSRGAARRPGGGAGTGSRGASRSGSRGNVSGVQAPVTRGAFGPGSARPMGEGGKGVTFR